MYDFLIHLFKFHMWRKKVLYRIHERERGWHRKTERHIDRHTKHIHPHIPSIPHPSIPIKSSWDISSYVSFVSIWTNKRTCIPFSLHSHLFVFLWCDNWHHFNSPCVVGGVRGFSLMGKNTKHKPTSQKRGWPIASRDNVNWLW